MAVAEKKTFPKNQKETPTTLRFQLVESHVKGKPVDSKTGEMVENPYPPLYIAPNGGVARDPKTGEQRLWRYIYGINTIWEDEQTGVSKPQLDNSTGKNDLIFRKGFMNVSSTDKAKVAALTVQDGFEGNENPLENTPKLFRLVDHSKDRKDVRNKADEAYEAETAARNAELEEMLPVAVFFGINVDDQDEERIRTEFIFKAKTMPTAFLRQFVNPKNKIQFVIAQALQKNVISSAVIPGQLVLVETQKALFPVDSAGDVAEQVASLVMQNDEQALKLYTQLQKL